MTTPPTATDVSAYSSLGAITFYLAQNQQAQAKLQAELDAALGPPGGDASDEGVVPPYEHVKHLPYLLDAINEGLRIHSTGGMGFPREVPESGMTIAGKYFPAGTVVGCPLLTLHRLKSVWGEDADEYNPDRWSRGDRAEMLKAFAPFQVGPRCAFLSVAQTWTAGSACVQGLYREEPRYDGDHHLRGDCVPPLPSRPEEPQGTSKHWHFIPN